jgi:hypothetical protein
MAKKKTPTPETEGVKEETRPKTRKRDKIDDNTLMAIVDAELADAMGKSGSRLSKDREKALRYYNGEAVNELSPPEAEGRSRVVSLDVSDTVEWILPSLLKIFTSSDEAVVFEPASIEDEEAAEQQTDYANYVFYRQNNGFVILHNFIKDALLQRTGILKVWFEKKKDETREEYEGLTDMELAKLLQDPEVEPIEHSQIDEPVSLPDGTQVTQALHSVTLKRTKDNSKICIDNIPNEEFLFSRKARSADRLFSCHHRVLKTISELRAMGYDNVDQISHDESTAEFNQERLERARRNDEFAYNASGTGVTMDESMRQVWITESYIQVDYDNDGIAEWRKVVKANKTLLENEEVDDHPFVIGTPILMPHELVGKSVADQVMDIQQIKTVLTRQMLDNMYLTNNPRTIIDESKGVNIDDLLDTRIGGIIRTKDIGAVQPFAVQQLNPISFSVLEYIETVKENRTGVTKYNQGLDANSLNKTATGINAIMGAAQQRIELIARVIAETGVKALFQKIIKLSLTHQKVAQTIRLRNKWKDIDPRNWETLYDLTINVGLGTGNKDQMAQHLMGILNVQKEAMASGLPIVDAKHIYNTASKLATNMGFKDGDMFFIDPESDEAKQKMQQQPPKQDPEAIKAQGEAQVKMTKAQSDAAMAQNQQAAKIQELQHQQMIDAQESMAKIEADKQVAITRSNNDAALEQQKMEKEYALKREIEMMKIASACYVKTITASKDAQPIEDDMSVNPMMETLNNLVGMFAHSMNAPKSITMQRPDGTVLQGTVQTGG